MLQKFEQKQNVASWWIKLTTLGTVLETAKKKIRRMQDQISEDIGVSSAPV